MTHSEIIRRYGLDILRSDGMRRERGFMQHGRVSVYEHSIVVTAMCITISDTLHLDVDMKALVRGALLHDYFLYDWHKPGHAGHGFSHAARALELAEHDFELGDTERDMIVHHMFPLNFSLPKTCEGAILCVADKICALAETLFARRRR